MTDRARELVERHLDLITDAHTLHFNPGQFEQTPPIFEDSDDLFDALVASANKISDLIESLQQRIERKDAALQTAKAVITAEPFFDHDSQLIEVVAFIDEALKESGK